MLALFAAMVPQFVTVANACTCAPIPSPYKAYQEASAVFVGKVVSSKDVPMSEKFRGEKYTYQERHFLFAVSEALKGKKDSEIDINAGRTDSSCYSGFAVDESYLVYAFGQPGPLESGMCTRTNHLSDAKADLHYIRALLRGVPEPRVYGAVTRIDDDLTKATSSHVTPMEGIRIIIEGASQKFETVTDKQGLYSLLKVPDGRYKIRPVVPAKYRVSFPTEEEFVLGSKEQLDYPVDQVGTSAYARFRLSWNNGIKGKILDSEGNAIIRANVSVMLPRASSPLVIQEDQYDHHRDGEYEFSGLTPGKYLLSVKIRAPFQDPKRLSHFYYPNSDDLAQADEVSIGESESLEERDIRLPPGYLVRKVEGMVVWPNGVPVDHAWVFLADAKDSADDNKKYDWQSTDELGRFSLQGYVGAEYWVHALAPMSLRIPPNQSTPPEPIKVIVGRVNEPLKFVIPFPKTPEP